MITRAHIEAAQYEAMYLDHYRVMEFAPVKQNPMFTPLQHFLTKFVRPPGSEKWKCPVCGRKRGRAWFWTQLVPFRAADTSRHSFQLEFGPVLEALTPVCGDHPLTTWTEE